MSETSKLELLMVKAAAGWQERGQWAVMDTL
jgi:hypothetical protein